MVLPPMIFLLSLIQVLQAALLCKLCAPLLNLSQTRKEMDVVGCLLSLAPNEYYLPRHLLRTSEVHQG